MIAKKSEVAEDTLWELNLFTSVVSGRFLRFNDCFHPFLNQNDSFRHSSPFPHTGMVVKLFSFRVSWGSPGVNGHQFTL